MRWMCLLSLSLSLLISVFAGCSAHTSTDSDVKQDQRVSIPSGPLRLLVLDDPGLATILEREWRARSDEEIHVTNDSTSNLLNQLEAGLRKLDTDIVIFPSAMLGELVESQVIRQLPAKLLEAAEYKQFEVFSLIRRREMLWDERPYAVSFGSPSLVLLRRTDLVANPPQTWQELSREVERLAQALPEDIQPLLQPLADGWASRILLARASSYVFDSSRVSTVFDYRSFEPRIGSPPFVRALRELRSDCQHSPSSHSPGSALGEFLDGKCAMAITWASALPTTGDEADPVAFPVAITDLPGSSSRYDFRKQQWVDIDSGAVRRVTVTGLSGRLAAVSRSAKNAELATTFLGWASGPEQSARLSPRSTETSVFRESHLASPKDWIHPRLTDVAAHYVEVVSGALSRSEAIGWPRIPGQHKYASVLDDAVLDVVRQRAAVAATLSNASEKWTDISHELGIDKQMGAYRRSLGIDIR